ncbi:hypothetical protein [Nocardioides euryhalodurans]|uniref:Family 2 glycosyl transferase n=1 Tax=Nocardioides euryhalodurans TaxID=2518370 RepID=A0A4P7GL54_9ACTN|nr:hypothetical protein [Nocardioides euryhalodurans]QBR92816.1 hypothetical protein EXE57_11425 [Nocardioides euryhalodurans]
MRPRGAARPAVLAAAAALAASALVGCAGPDEPDGPSGPSWAPRAEQVDGLEVVATADADGFRLHTASGDKTFLPGVNLGSTVPLQQPGEVGTIPAEQYAAWLREMADLGIRVVRVYTLLPPGFYEELAAHNEAHPEDPIYLVQGAYLPDESYVDEGGTLHDPAVDDAFSEELADLSAAVHGDLDRPETPGRASGRYTVDVSAWLASWIIGVEWDPEGVARTDAVEVAYRSGEYFAATGDATPTEQWIATHMDELAAHEADRGSAAPIAMVNWPTTDPLVHPEEPLPQEDLVSVDPMHVLPTDAWPAGTFASFHAYPYYPDFQRYEPGLQDEEWDGREDPYAGYVAALRDHVAGTMPLLVTEFGVPSSLGSAHAGPLGRDQGGHTEQQAMAVNADLMRLLEAKGAAGAFVFSWEDEWFKRTWNTLEHQDEERRQLWHDPLTNEQWFGLVATDPDPLPDAAAEAIPESGAFEYVHVWADASWVHLEVTTREAVPEVLRIEADVLPGPERADYRIEVDPGAGEARLDVRRDLDPIRLDTPERPYHPDQDDPWHLYRLITNRSHDVGGEQRPAEFLDVGQLVEGTWDPESEEFDSTATWQVDEERRTVRLRIPWSMLGFSDPSSRQALGEGVPAERVEVEGIDLSFDAGGSTLDVPFTWPTWNYTTYVARMKAGVDVVERAYRDLAP